MNADERHGSVHVLKPSPLRIDLKIFVVQQQMSLDQFAELPMTKRTISDRGAIRAFDSVFIRGSGAISAEQEQSQPQMNADEGHGSALVWKPSPLHIELKTLLFHITSKNQLVMPSFRCLLNQFAELPMTKRAVSDRGAIRAFDSCSSVAKEPSATRASHR
jgi:hypothetical protein